MFRRKPIFWPIDDPKNLSRSKQEILAQWSHGYQSVKVRIAHLSLISSWDSNARFVFQKTHNKQQR